MLSTLQSAAETLTDAAKFTATKASVASDAPFSATSSASATAGSYSVEVLALAKEQRVATSASTEFTPARAISRSPSARSRRGLCRGKAAKTLSFAGGSLEEFRDAINGGEPRRYRVGDKQWHRQAARDQGQRHRRRAGLRDYRNDRAQRRPHRQRRVDRSVHSLASAQDAQLDVDGIVVSRSSNTVDDVIDGVTLTLNKQDVGNASTLTITDDRSGATTAINAFVSAYNNLNTTIKSPPPTTRNSDGREPQRGFDGALDPVAIAHHAR